MINRKEIKCKSKATLKRSYWHALLVSFLLIVSGAGGSGSWTNSRYWGNNINNKSQSHNGAEEFSDIADAFDSLFDYPDDYTYGGRLPSHDAEVFDYSHKEDFDRDADSSLYIMILIIAIVAIFILLLLFAYRIFLGYPLEVGCKNFFIKSGHSEKISLNGLVVAFKSEVYMNVIKAMLLRSFFIFLWGLFFFLIFAASIVFSVGVSVILLPAVFIGVYYKLYSYSLVPYILAENPSINPSRVLQLSQQMTSKHTFNMFIFDLSFAGWYMLSLFGVILFLIIGYFASGFSLTNVWTSVGTYILCGFIFNLLILAVHPYLNTGRAYYYFELKELALQKGLAEDDEFGR